MRKMIINTFNTNTDRRIDRRFSKLLVLSSNGPTLNDIAEDTIGVYFNLSNDEITAYLRDGNTLKSKVFLDEALPKLLSPLKLAQPGTIIDSTEKVDFLAAKVGLLGDFVLPFSDLSYEKRFPVNAALIQHIHSQSDETLHGIHELSNAAVPLYQSLLEKMGLKTLTARYAPDNGSFNFLFGFNPEIYEVITTVQFHYTQYETEHGIQHGKGTPDAVRNALTKEEKFKRHLSTEFEKSAQLIWLKNKKTNDINLIVHTHPGIEMQHRIDAMKLLCEALHNHAEKLREWMPEECKNIPDSWLLTIISGDLNLFDPRTPVPTMLAEQIAILKNNGYRFVSEGLARLTLATTFISFPFDIFRFLTKDDLTELKLLTQSVKEGETEPHVARLWIIDKIIKKDIPLFSCCLDGAFISGLPENSMVSTTAYFRFFGTPITTADIQDARALQNQFLQRFADHPAHNDVEPPVGSDHASLQTIIRY